MTTYRAAYWQSEDKQAEVVLTSEEQASLSDAELRAAAETEAASTGLDFSTGEIKIGPWRDGEGESAAARSSALLRA